MYKQTLLKFQTPHYQNNKDKKKLFKEINEKFSYKIGIPYQKLVYIETIDHEDIASKTKGKFYPQKNTIEINIYRYTNPFIILSTILHETIHMYLFFIMKYNLNSNYIETMTFEKYVKLVEKFFKPKYLIQREMFENFKNFTRQLKISQSFVNILKIDKLYYNFVSDSQPYFYNVDSHELLAEYLTQKEMLYFIDKFNSEISAKDINQFKDYIGQEVYFDNIDTKLKRIYIEQNIKDNLNFRLYFYKLIESIKLKQNLFDIKNYDINRYIEYYQIAKENNLKLKEFLSLD